jgi:hypothetical protein
LHVWFFAYILEAKNQMKIPESFLHYVWRLKRFDFSNLQTTEGEKLHILDWGQYNTNAGPDFLNARISIGFTLWIGHIEIHVLSSDWLKHGHGNQYDNVILHVVLEEDEWIYNSSGCRLPCLELKKRIPKKLLGSYQKLLRNEFWIPCQHHFPKVNSITKDLWLERLLVDRLEDKLAVQKNRFIANNHDWEASFYQFLARGLGMKVNAEAMDELSQRVPLSIIRKHKHSLFQLEALFFGQSGLLRDTIEEAYPQKLLKEYRFLSKKFDLEPMTGAQWNFLRLRPANFPSIRIAQLATLHYQTDNLFQKTLVAETLPELNNMLELKLSNYWHDHYRFGKSSKPQFKRLGKTSKHSLIINTIVPFLFLYALERQNEKVRQKCLQWLEQLGPERNKIIRQWQKLGIEPTSAFQTQALLQLKSKYCDRKRCTECSIGHSILSKC